MKLHDPFKFPESVQLGQLLGHPDVGEYALLSVLMHRGKADSGHYWSFVRDGARWLQFNDTEVTEVTLETVLETGKGSNDSDASASCLVFVKKELITGEGVDMNSTMVTLSGALQELVSEDDQKLDLEIEEWNKNFHESTTESTGETVAETVAETPAAS